MDGHPDLDRLLAVAEGDHAALVEVSAHIAMCFNCRARLAEVRGVMAAVSDELLADRSACPPPQELAMIPPGAARDIPHFSTCPLCRAEIEVLDEFVAWEVVDRAFVTGPPARPDRVIRGERALFQDAASTLRLELKSGAQAAGIVAGARVSLEVRAGILEVAVATPPTEPLVLVLENEVLVKRLPIRDPRLSVQVAYWTSARVGPRAGLEP